MKTKIVRLDEITPAQYNPRQELKPADAEYKALKNSMEKFGLTEPIIVNVRTGNIVGGHQRFNILKKMQVTETEAVIIDVDEKQEKLLNVALNKIEGKWDYEKLGQLLKEFDFAALDITGFSADELSILIKADDDLNETEQWDEWNDAATEEEGASWVIELQFNTADDADYWLREKGLAPQIKPGSSTTVIRMEE